MQQTTEEMMKQSSREGKAMQGTKALRRMCGMTCNTGSSGVLTHLNIVADALDRNRRLEVFPGGLVLPSEGAPGLIQTLGYEEFINEQQIAGKTAAAGTFRPATGSRERATARGSAWKAGSAAPQLIQSRIDLMSPNDLAEVRANYPQLVIRTTSAGIWLTGILNPLGPRGDKTWLALAYPAALDVPVRAWAWWDVGLVIGPRHTYADASICAYEPSDMDGSWREERGLTQLVDFISVWTVRQVLLSARGVWFGTQCIHTALERIIWQRPGEFCGCGGKKRYDACHAHSDERKTDEELLEEIVTVAPHLRNRQLRAIRDAVTARRYPRTWEELATAASQPSSHTRRDKAR